MGQQTVVIVGASHAGFQAAASLRQLRFEGRVVLIGEEPGLPYHRPPLSKDFLTGASGDDQIRLRPLAFYAKSNIELIESTKISAILRETREVKTEAGDKFAYDHLILATGARHRVPPLPGADLDGVMALRDRAEAVRLRAMMATARNIVIVGAGFIGLEFASVAVKTGARVTLLETASRPLARAVSAPISEAISAFHAANGAVIRVGVAVDSLVGEAGKISGVRLAGGEVAPADLVLLAVGVRPNIELAAEAGLPAANGVLVDEHLLTADPAISAIGDCAAYPNPYSGEITRLESVQNATDQARCVAERLIGRPAPYVKPPWFWSDQGSIKLQIVGLTAGSDLAVPRGDPRSEAFSVFCFRDGRLRGIESINRPADHMAGRKLLTGFGTISPSEAADASFVFPAS